MASLTKNTKLCLVGSVSAGKSTFLNSVFCQKLTQCKIKRTTMVPTRYIENESAVDDEENIYRKVSEKNEEIIKKTEQGEKLIEADYEELEFNVGKLDMTLMKGRVDIYDIPGLNDARTKAEYYKYLEDNFHKFNVIVLFVDIMSGLNTSDEMDILKFIITQTCYHKEKGRNIYTMVVVNKADDMILKEDNSLTLSGELGEMFEQVKRTTSIEFANKGIEDHMVGITPFCAKDAFLYRMVKKYPDYDLSDEERIKIGLNEMGKKFSKFPIIKQVELVKEILQDKEFIDTMINLSGFNQLQTCLSTFLERTGKGFEIENTLYKIRSMTTVTDVFEKYTNTACSLQPSPTFSNKEIYSHIAEYVDLYEKIREIDQELYEDCMKTLLGSILYFIENHMVEYTKPILSNPIRIINKLLDDNDDFMTNIIFKYFTHFYEYFYDENDYVVVCMTLIDYCMTALYLHLHIHRVNLSDICMHFMVIKRMKMFNKETLEQVLDKIISNSHENTTIRGFIEVPIFIKLLDEIKEIVDGKKLNAFIRFVILNQIKNKNYNAQSIEHSDELFIRHMLYQSYHELPICNVLGLLRTKMIDPSFQLIVKGYEANNDERFLLDAYYLKCL